MEEEENRVVIASSTQRKRKRRKIRRRRSRRRRNEKPMIAPSSLPNDVVEEIFLRFPVKALFRLKTLSKQWRSTIESQSFEERHLRIAEQFRVGHPRVIVITEKDPLKLMPLARPDTDIGFRSFCLESGSHLSFTLLNFPQSFVHYIYVSGCCDGLFCIHSPKSQAVYVVNPATRWLRQLPPARFQILMHKFNPTYRDWIDMESVFHLAFVKASDYKLVWLYNSDKYNADASSPNEGVTKCEVFDFRANAWRYLACTPSYRIYHDQIPACANGSIYWFTEPYNDKIEVVAFDIHTESFRLLPKIKPAIAGSDPRHIDMSTLDNGLCMSKREPDTLVQEIWRLKSSEDLWEKIYTIDLLSCSSSRTQFRDEFDWSRKDLVDPSTPVAVCKNKKMLLSHRYSRGLVKYDPLTKSLTSFYQHPLSKRKVLYFQSLISHI
ncbi:Galactose oxidase/kelch beta-propeller [Arabidopsis suecica]|uniref:Galactose oxidase/kelch beta-propeller n=1 Tax=Arabidopsis suecica TaxID=45249 RepID=A0A8T2H3L4_ARASU|nr:Galactose oxidase/kelch beta-propeller [Arabidopsis suecica]